MFCAIPAVTETQAKVHLMQCPSQVSFAYRSLTWLSSIKEDKSVLLIGGTSLVRSNMLCSLEWLWLIDLADSLRKDKTDDDHNSIILLTIYMEIASLF